MLSQHEMNDTRCRKCDLLNLPDALYCLKCQAPLQPAPKTRRGDPVTSEVSAPATEIYQLTDIPFSSERFGSATGSASPDTKWPDLRPAGKTGSRTYFWYRLLCSAIVVFGIIVAIIGIIAMLASFNDVGKEATDAFTGGVIFLVAGAGPAILCLLGVVFPPRTWSWIYGLIVLVMLTLTCALVPVSVPLLIFWVKSETQAFFGRT